MEIRQSDGAQRSLAKRPAPVAKPPLCKGQFLRPPPVEETGSRNWRSGQLHMGFLPFMFFQF